MKTAPKQRFEFVGGSLCLDFANTVSAVRTKGPRDHLQSYGVFLEWAQLAGALERSQIAKLLRESRRHAAGAARVFRRAIELRSAIYKIFSALADEAPVPESALSQLNRELIDATLKSRLVPRRNHFEWQLIPEECGLFLPVHAVARDTARLLTSPEINRVRECRAPRCSWLFLDTSRNHRRNWCDMSVCGNRAKQRRHRQTRQRKHAV